MLLKTSNDKNKKGIVVLPHTSCQISYNINNNIPNLKVKHNDYETIREMVENDGSNNSNKIIFKKEETVTKNIKNYKIV